VKVIRSPRTSHFTTLSNDLIEDSSLSFKARGLLVYLLSRPDNWRTDAHRLARSSTEGRASILSGLKELAQVGYLKRTRMQDEHGHWVTACEVFDTPAEVRFSDVGSPNAGSPNAGFPDSVTKTDTKDPPTPATDVAGEPCAAHKHLGRPHRRCRQCGTAGRPKCAPESPGRLSERCRASDGRNCKTTWCQCPHHQREAS
jgi:hypothetical protein